MASFNVAWIRSTSAMGGQDRTQQIVGLGTSGSWYMVTCMRKRDARLGRHATPVSNDWGHVWIGGTLAEFGVYLSFGKKVNESVWTTEEKSVYLESVEIWRALSSRSCSRLPIPLSVFPLSIPHHARLSTAVSKVKEVVDELNNI
jgi:hypothetical protein